MVKTGYDFLHVEDCDVEEKRRLLKRKDGKLISIPNDSLGLSLQSFQVEDRTGKLSIVVKWWRVLKLLM